MSITAVKGDRRFNQSLRGTFDGQNYIISNATFERVGDYIGLFGNVQLGTLKNFGIKNFRMTGGGTAKYCGAIAGEYFSDKVIENVYAKGIINLSFNFGTNTVASVYVGGFVGSIYRNNMEIDGVSYSISANVSNCYVNSDITVDSPGGSYIRYRMGGFTGVISTTSNEQVDIKYCVLIGDVKNINTSSKGYYGGLQDKTPQGLIYP